MKDLLNQSTIDKDSLRRKYREERDKRMRPDGNDQHLEIKERLVRYLDDPYTPSVERAPKTDHVTFAVIGGTWHWNRYPGAQCDTASLIYLALFEETDPRPTEK